MYRVVRNTTLATGSHASTGSLPAIQMNEIAKAVYRKSDELKNFGREWTGQSVSRG